MVRRSVLGMVRIQGPTEKLHAWDGIGLFSFPFYRIHPSDAMADSSRQGGKTKNPQFRSGSAG